MERKVFRIMGKRRREARNACRCRETRRGQVQHRVLGQQNPLWQEASATQRTADPGREQIAEAHHATHLAAIDDGQVAEAV